MKKKFSMITLGMILDDIKNEGKNLGKNWDVKRLYITRNEASPKNIAKVLEKILKKNPSATEADAKAKLRFPFYSNIEGQWRTFTSEEAEDLKDRIKQARKYTV